MKNWTKILIFLCLQCAVIGLSILVGWNYGLPADRQKLKNQETWLQEAEYLSLQENNQSIDFLQSVVELLQIETNVIKAIDVLNGEIDFKITHFSGWREFGNPRGLEWPGGEDQFNLIHKIVKYRQKYPTCFTNYPPWITKETLGRIFDEAEKCKIRRISAPNWTPPPTTQVYTINEPSETIIEPGVGCDAETRAHQH